MRYFLAVLALAGVIVSVLSLRVHYSTDVQPCSINATWDCGIVNHSDYAEILHIPVAAVGIAGYLALGLLAFFRQRYLTLLAAAIGMIFALRLTWIEELVLNVWCLYCVISQAIIAILMLSALGWFTAEYLSLRRAQKQA
jgi:uncharacterized membrane protein